MSLITKEFLQELSANALRVALIQSDYTKNQFSHLRIDEDGQLYVVFDTSFRGSHDESWEDIALEDLSKDSETLVKEWHKKKEDEKTLKEQKEKDKKEKEQAETKAKEYEKYLELKSKFETSGTLKN